MEKIILEDIQVLEKCIVSILCILMFITENIFFLSGY